MIRQDFTNPVHNEIAKLEKMTSLIKEELEIRKIIDIEDSLDAVINKKSICSLEIELAAKEEYLSKLQEKLLIDKAENDQDYDEFLKDNIDEIKSKVQLISNEHQKAECEYILKELELYHKEKNKEGVVFFYNAIKAVLKNVRK